MTLVKGKLSFLMKELGHIPPHGANVRIFSRILFFLHAHGILASVYFGKNHMVQRHVIRSRYPRRICPYWLNPHGATPFNPCKHLISIYAHMVQMSASVYFGKIHMVRRPIFYFSGHHMSKILFTFMPTWYNIFQDNFSHGIVNFFYNPHGVSSDVYLYFGHHLYNILLLFSVHMVYRHVIPTRNTHGIRPLINISWCDRTRVILCLL